MESQTKQHPITSWLSHSNPHLFNAYCMAAAFMTYFCMYAFRKPFSVATFEGQVELPLLPLLDYKIVLIISQVLGYTLSKFLGIKVVSEAGRSGRARMLIAMIVAAELALLGFGLVPKPWNIVFLFLNGIPLGMIWGLTFSFLEGRKSTELLGAGLSTSYIVASGAVKSVGREVMSWGISEFWMPFVTGLMFFPFLLIAVFLMSRIPDPSAEDIALRTKREPMDAASRGRFFKMYAPGLVSLTVFYMLLTAFRDFRDNFSREIWDSIGYAGQAAQYTVSEVPIAIAVLIMLAAVMFIKNNSLATLAVHALLIGGALLIGVSTYAFQMGWITPMVWMVSTGLGLYMGYVPFGCVLFDRLIALTGYVGTAGFMIYVTDAFGYLGSVALMLYKNFGSPNVSWLEFFTQFAYATSGFCLLGFGYSLFYFVLKGRAVHRSQSTQLA